MRRKMNKAKEVGDGEERRGEVQTELLRTYEWTASGGAGLSEALVAGVA